MALKRFITAICAMLSLALIGSVLTVPTVAHGATFQEARSLFSAGDIVGASKALDGVLKNRRGLNAKLAEEAMKLQGVCKFLIGDTNGARAMFQAVLKKNPAAQLARADVLDPKIASFFDAQRPGTNPASIEGEAVTEGGGGGPAPAPGPRAGRSRAVSTAGRATVRNSRGGAFTGVNVALKGAAHATVFIDDIIVGKNGEDITIEPGSHTLQVSTEGFEPYTQPLKIKRGQRVSLFVTLRRPAPAGAAIAATGAAPRASGGGVPDSKRRVDYTSDLPKSKVPPSESLASEYFKDQQASARREPPQQQQAPAQQPQLPPPQMGTVPYGQAPYGGQGGQGGTQANTQGYTGGRGGQPAPQPVAQPVREDDKSVLLACMPFGIGQFQNDKYLKGAVFLGLEGLALGDGVYRYVLVQDQKQASASYLSQQPSDVKYKQDSDTYISTNQREEYIAFGVFGVAYVIGVVDALVDYSRGPDGRPARAGFALQGDDGSIFMARPIVDLGYDPMSAFGNDQRVVRGRSRLGLNVELTF